MEKSLYFLVFVFMFLGLLLLIPQKKKNTVFNFGAAEASEKRKSILDKKKLTMKDKIMARADSMLLKMGKDRSYLKELTAGFAILGFILGLICFKRLFLSLVSAICFSPLSYLYLVLKTQEATREELSELQTAMSVITNSYIGSNNIVKAVETYVLAKRNSLSAEELKFHKTTPFEAFVAQCVTLNPNIDNALEMLAYRINNKYFNEWVKNLRMCIKDRNMKFSLQPVIQQMADEKIMQIESDGAMRKAWQTYLTMVGLMYGTVFIFRIVQKDWYDILVGTFIGQMLIVLMLLVSIVSAVFVIRINKPLSDI